MTDDDNVTELAHATTRLRNEAVAKFRQRRKEIGLRMTAPYYGRQIPPTLDPCHAGWIALLTDGYEGLVDLTNMFRQKVLRLVGVGNLDPTVSAELMTHFDEFRGAIVAAAEVIENWTPAADSDDDTIPSDVHRIADHGKYVYAIGSRDISWMQHRLKQLAYAGRIDIEAHNELQHDLCYDIGEPIYSMTTSKLHDYALWDGGWDWDDNTYSDGRQVMIRALITDWQELFDEVPWNPAIKCYGDGVINEHQRGVVCLIAPPDPRPEDECGHPVIEISIADLKRQPWINTRWDAKTAADWNRAEGAERACRDAQLNLECWRRENAHHLEASKLQMPAALGGDPVVEAVLTADGRNDMEIFQ